MCKVNAERMEEAISRKGDLFELIMRHDLQLYDVSCAGYEMGVVFEMDNDLAEAVNERQASTFRFLLSKNIHDLVQPQNAKMQHSKYRKVVAGKVPYPDSRT
jgi:hypothetical protein